MMRRGMKGNGCRERGHKKKLARCSAGGWRAGDAFSFNLGGWFTFSCIYQRRIPDRGLRQAFDGLFGSPWAALQRPLAGVAVPRSLHPSMPSAEHSPSQGQPLFGLAGHTTASNRHSDLLHHPFRLWRSCPPAEPGANKEGEVDVTLPSLPNRGAGHRADAPRQH